MSLLTLIAFGCNERPPPNSCPFQWGVPPWEEWPLQQLWRVNPIQGHSSPSPIGCNQASVTTTLRVSFSCPILSSSLPERSISQEQSPVNLLHATLHLRVYFQAIHLKTKALQNKQPVLENTWKEMCLILIIYQQAPYWMLF